MSSTESRSRPRASRSSEFSSGGGGIGRIEIITRPGNGQWRGSVTFGLRHSALDARNVFALVKPELDQQRYAFNFGGPLIRKRLDFSVNVDRTPTHGSSLVSATTLNGLFTANVPAPSENNGLSFRAGLLINSKNTLNLNYNYRGSERASSNLDDKLNFAPRFSIAWSPFQNRQTVIRAGGGIFFDRLSASAYANTLRYDNQKQKMLTILNPVYLAPLPADLSALNPNINVRQLSTTREVLDPNLHAPYNANGMLSLEQQLPKALVGTFSYSLNRGIHLFRTRNINAPLPASGERPDPTQGSINATESAGKSIRHELAFGLSRRFNTRFIFFGNYRLAWAKDDGGLPADNYNLRPEWARSSSDRRHSFNLMLMVNLPWGLRLTPNLFINSGAPFNITTGLDDNLDTQFNDRPAGIGRNSDLPASLYPLIPQPERPVSVADGPTLPLIDYLSTYYPNGLRAVGPGSFNANLGISKTLALARAKTSRPGWGLAVLIPAYSAVRQVSRAAYAWVLVAWVEVWVADAGAWELQAALS
jgi:hypothetical protein